MGGSHVRSSSFSGAMTTGLRTRYRRLRPDEDPTEETSTFNIVVMEVGRGSYTNNNGGRWVLI